MLTNVAIIALISNKERFPLIKPTEFKSCIYLKSYKFQLSSINMKK